MSERSSQSLPPVLAGPVLRHTTFNRLTLWLVGSCALSLRLRLYLQGADEPWMDRVLTEKDVTRVRFGTSAYLYLIDVETDDALPVNTRIGYDLGVLAEASDARGSKESWIRDWAPHLCLPDTDRPDFSLDDRRPDLRRRRGWPHAAGHTPPYRPFGFV